MTVAFLRAHGGEIAGADFFTIFTTEVSTPRGLIG
jgi:hypothetical protein